MITFKVNNVRPTSESSKRVGTAAAWERLKLRPEVSSKHEDLIECPMHPLVGAVRTAWNQHKGLMLSPDAIWLAIAQGFAAHVNLHAEELRKHFVQHEGKAKIVVRRDDFVKGSATNPWEEVFSYFSEAIGQHIGKRKDLIIADFSTTTASSRAASEIVLVETVQEYFEYRFRTCCGIPEITLAGTKEDWKRLLTRAWALSEFACEDWVLHLVPVLENFVRAFEGNADKSFWSRIFNQNGGSGGPYVTGWVNVFFPIINKRPNGHMDWVKSRQVFGGLNPDDFPTGMSSAPFVWEYFAEEIPMQFLGGFIGASERAGVVTPEIGWGVAENG